jgi:hypothetical protein
LHLLEGIYEYIINDQELHFGIGRGFNDYSTAQGYGSMGFCYGLFDEEALELVGLPRPALSNAELKKMDELAAFWREYLASSYRMRLTDPE